MELRLCCSIVITLCRCVTCRGLCISCSTAFGVGADAGDAFGERSLLHDLPHSASVIAAEVTELLVVPKNDFLAAVHAVPMVSFQPDTTARGLAALMASHTRLMATCAEIEQQYVQRHVQRVQVAAETAATTAAEHDAVLARATAAQQQAQSEDCAASPPSTPGSSGVVSPGGGEAYAPTSSGQLDPAIAQALVAAQASRTSTALALQRAAANTARVLATMQRVESLRPQCSLRTLRLHWEATLALLRRHAAPTDDNQLVSVEAVPSGAATAGAGQSSSGATGGHGPVRERKLSLGNTWHDHVEQLMRHQHRRLLRALLCINDFDVIPEADVARQRLADEFELHMCVQLGLRATCLCVCVVAPLGFLTASPSCCDVMCTAHQVQAWPSDRRRRAPAWRRQRQ